MPMRQQNSKPEDFRRTPEHLVSVVAFSNQPDVDYDMTTRWINLADQVLVSKSTREEA